MATARRSGRQPGKSDPIDALAVTQAALRERTCRRAPGRAEQAGQAGCDHRAEVVVERTKLCNRHAVRVRLNGGGNRTVNWAPHITAPTQAAQGSVVVRPTRSGCWPPARPAPRRYGLLRRRLSDVGFRALLASERRQVTPAAADQAAAA
jgi:hypothetical protein